MSHQAQSEDANDAVQAKPTPGRTRSTSIGTTDVLRAELRRGGVLALFQGMGPELARGVLSAALMMMVKEKIVGTVRRAVVGDARGRAAPIPARK